MASGKLAGKLIQARIDKLSDGRHGDGNGLWLQVRGERKSWTGGEPGKAARRADTILFGQLLHFRKRVLAATGQDCSGGLRRCVCLVESN